MANGNVIMPIVAANLKSHREARKMSQGDLAQIAGCTAQSIHAYETGKADCSFKMLCALARALEIPWQAFFEEGTPDTDVITVPRELWNRLRQLESAIVAVAGRPGDVEAVRFMLTTAKRTPPDAGLDLRREAEQAQAEVAKLAQQQGVA